MVKENAVCEILMFLFIFFQVEIYILSVHIYLRSAFP